MFISALPLPLSLSLYHSVIITRPMTRVSRVPGCSDQYLHRCISLNFTEDLVEMLVPVGSDGGGGEMDGPPTLSRPAVEIRLGETSHIPYLLLSRRENMQITN